MSYFRKRMGKCWSWLRLKCGVNWKWNWYLFLVAYSKLLDFENLPLIEKAFASKHSNFKQHPPSTIYFIMTPQCTGNANVIHHWYWVGDWDTLFWFDVNLHHCPFSFADQVQIMLLLQPLRTFSNWRPFRRLVTRDWLWTARRPILSAMSPSNTLHSSGTTMEPWSRAKTPASCS